MIPRLGSAVVLGAGTMGAQIACLFADAGARVALLDLDATVAARGLDRATKLRPAALRSPASIGRITIGGFDDLENVIAGADWIVEAVVEQLDPKRALLSRIDAALFGRNLAPADTPVPQRTPVVSSNTSGIPIASLADGRSAAFRRAFLGTHFFNPPRYSRLLELIPTANTDPERVAWIEDVGSRRLGKGTVRANDRPAFIANRLGVHGLLVALALAQELGLGVDEVDDLTGPLLGRPKSATFRTLDLVGLDVAVAVADHCHADLPDDPQRDRFRTPDILRRLIADGRLGEKTGAGFFRKVDGEILALDLDTYEYRPRRRATSPLIDSLKAEKDLARRLALIPAAAERPSEDRVPAFLWRLLAETSAYAATVAPEIAGDAASVDRAMRWGFGWGVGPLEAWDAIGIERMSAALTAAGIAVPELVTAIAAPTGPGRFHDAGRALDLRALALVELPARPGLLDLDARRAVRPDLPSNAAGTAIDLGRGVLGVELHGKLNIIGTDTLSILARALDAVDPAGSGFDGLVVGTRAADFSAGANIALMVVAAEEGEWDELDRLVRRLQGLAIRFRASPFPVVAAPRGRTLGGGAELCLAADRSQPLAETYIGLVETGIGLIPAGGGTTAMARRAADRVPAGSPADPFPFVQAALETIAMAKVASSAEDAIALGLLQPSDQVTVDPDRQWADAAATVRHLAAAGYRAPAEAPIRVAGRRGIAAAEALTYNQVLARAMSPHDRTVVMELARTMSGGDVAEGTEVPASYLLDLEREAFLRLLGERLTRDRMRHTLKTGKPLRN
ncbi:MAG TPA: 3-hydroxyacyl-CoA dehydrogenase/enoyl-CoA hydratase family protein [Candidatus Limnocylindrales bacterium]